MESSYSSARTKPLYRGTQIIWYITGVLEAILAFRFVLKIFGANPGAGFSSFINAVSYPFAGPFINVFGISQMSGSVVEWTTLLAMFVYLLIAWAIIKILVMSKVISTPEAASKLDDQES